jgi:hypothetical protein
MSCDSTADNKWIRRLVLGFLKNHERFLSSFHVSKKLFFFIVRISKCYCLYVQNTHLQSVLRIRGNALVGHSLKYPLQGRQFI